MAGNPPVSTFNLFMDMFLGLRQDYMIQSHTAPPHGEAPRAAASFNFALRGTPVERHGSIPTLDSRRPDLIVGPLRRPLR